MTNDQKLMALHIYPGGREERRFAHPDWLEIDMAVAAEKLESGYDVWIDPEDVDELNSQWTIQIATRPSNHLSDEPLCYPPGVGVDEEQRS